MRTPIGLTPLVSVNRLALAPAASPATVTASSGVLTRTSGKLTTSQSWQLLPSSQYGRGSNISFSYNTASYPFNGSQQGWPTLWGLAWNIDEVARRIDHVSVIGGNVIRMPGTVSGIYKGYLSRATYFERWRQVSQRCQERGLFLYPYLADYFNDDFAATPAATVQAEVTAAAAFLHTLPDIIGLDLVQETPDSFPASTAGVSIYNAVKAVTTLPLTYSSLSTLSALPPVNAPVSKDFHDYHIYSDPSAADATALTTYWSGGGTKPVFFGEFGNNGTDASATRLQNVRNLMANTTGSGGQRVAGGCNWGIEDFVLAGGGDLSGLFAGPVGAYAEKTSLTAVMRTIPIV